VGFLFGNSDLAEDIEDHFALYLEFSCQVIDSYLLLLMHSARFPPTICSVPVMLSSHPRDVLGLRREPANPGILLQVPTVSRPTTSRHAHAACIFCGMADAAP
jgi:hypothetical protein